MCLAFAQVSSIHQKNGLKVLKLVLHVSKMALKKWNMNFRFGTFRPEKQD